MSSSSSKLVLIKVLLSIAALSMTSAQGTLLGSIVSGVISCPVALVNNVISETTTIISSATVDLVDATGKTIGTAVTSPTGAFSIVVSGAQAITDTTLTSLKVILPNGTPCGVVNQVLKVPLTITSTVTGATLSNILNVANVVDNTLADEGLLSGGLLGNNGGGATGKGIVGNLLDSVSSLVGNHINLVSPLPV